MRVKSFHLILKNMRAAVEKLSEYAHVFNN